VSVRAAEIADPELEQVSRAVRKDEPAHLCDRRREKFSKREGEGEMCMKQTYKTRQGKGDGCEARVEKAGVEGR
jgi:hypothetical protein